MGRIARRAGGNGVGGRCVRAGGCGVGGGSPGDGGAGMAMRGLRRGASAGEVGLGYDGYVDVGGLGVLGFGWVDALADGYGDGGFAECGG